MDAFGQSGEFVIEYRPPPGEPGWAGPLVVPNGPTTEGLDYLLEAGFRGAAQGATWYAGLIDNAGFAALAAADTNASHPGWSEFTGVSGGNRPAWVPAAAASGQMGTATPSVVNVTAGGTVRGAFLSSRQPTGLSGAGTLYATAAAAAGLAVSAGGTLSITYTTRLTPLT